MDITDEKLIEFTEYLQGTCKSMNEAISDFFEDEIFDENDLTEEQLELIDEQVLRCDTCGWWVESGEIGEEGNCRDCEEE